MPDVYILSAVRTPIGRFGGALKDHSAVELAAHVMRAATERAGVAADALDLYVFGNVLRAGQGQLVPRQAAMLAGIPNEVDGMAVDMVCSSGMMSIMTAVSLIRSGDADVVLAGGTESMSRAGFYLSARARWGYKLLLGAPEQVVDVMLRDGLTDPMSGEAMGVQTERLAAEHDVTRRQLDEVAALSHQRADEATRASLLADEIEPIELSGKGDVTRFDRDEGIRADSSAESLARLRPAFTEDGVLTAGNSSQISDGAAALLIAGEDAVRAHGLKPLARIAGSAWAAGEPWRFPEAPIPAVHKTLERLGMRVGDVDLFENNEAFALNTILFERMLDVPRDRLNVHGGAVALGHPIGASGARIVTTLVHALRRRGGRTGLAAICHGTGGGTALAVEAV